MNNIINDFLDQFNYDVRISRNARFIDQKVTSDVLAIIADCIIEFVGDDVSKEFTTNDIWSSKYTKEMILDIFRKPDVDNEKASNEYDKFFGQPLKMLGYSKILTEEKRGNRNFYKIKDRKLLEYISIKERNALNFIQLYLIKVLSDSGVYYLFSNFFDTENKQSFDSLKEGFVHFMIENTSIKKETEPKRIFTKVINPLAFSFNKRGTKRGSLSPYAISYDELMYNRLNWRDIKGTKIKGETREEYERRAHAEVARRRGRYTDYSISKAKKIIQQLYSPNSEHQDEYANGEATQVHHIFMKSEFPYLADYVENLILLTGTQHNSKAHPSNNTKIINKDYQLLLLLSKLENIRKSIEKGGMVYSKNDFIEVLNTGLETNLEEDISFNCIRDELNNIYQSIQ